MTDFLDILKNVLAILPFGVLCVSAVKVNLPKPDRNKQFPMPLIALVYVVAAMLYLNKINTGLLSLLNNIPEWITQLVNYINRFVWIPEQISQGLSYVGGFVEMLLKELNFAYWIAYVSNTLIILAYLAIKRICLSVISKIIKSDGELFTRISDLFYDYFPEKSKWCIKDSFYQVRGMLKTFYYGAVILSGALMLVSRKLYFLELIKGVFYPVFGILLVGELYFYLDGLTRREYTNDILGEDEEAYKTVNYSLLRKFLRSLFSDKLLSENTGINNALAYGVTTDELLGVLEQSEDPKVVNFASYMTKVYKSGVQIDHNYLNSSLAMLNGKSILFNNPFYNDLIPYAFYPMHRMLLEHKKVLVVLGRHSVEDDVSEWLEKGIESVSNIPFMWNTGVLTKDMQELDIGIVTRSDVFDIELHNANAEFLENVGFVVILEPSKLVSTAQIGLNMLIKKCRANRDDDIVFCMCDKNCDGLVDAMSHIIMTSITEVAATKKHLGTSSYMCWEADGDYLHHRVVPNISRYLGLGTELSFAALKNQVSKTTWYGGEAFPVSDIRWIAKQYYYDLTRYASLPTSQEAMDEHFRTTQNFWSAEVEKNSYMTVEDEAYNMFEVLREFSTRTTEQGFINVISSEYLLKDYMADNSTIFETDAKAIPYICADYTRSNRNTVLRLILMMSTYPVCNQALEKEFSMLGIKVFDLKKQIWYELYNCYSEASKTALLPDGYREAVESAYSEKIAIDGKEWDKDIIEVGKTFNLRLGRNEITYSVNDAEFLAHCVTELKSAGYVAEDEKGERYYLGSELSGHIYQKYLPGQFFVFGGKNYEMQHLTADGQILVRRAADHINSRPTYRQMRTYTLRGTKPSDKIGAQKNVAGLKIIKEFADICVSTAGYYELDKYNDFANAKQILFEGEKNGIPDRVYRNKEIMRIELPDFDGKLNDKVRYTVALLFNEVFKTLFAENHAFICALTDDSFMEGNESANPLTYSIKCDGCDISRNAIYIIEDSQLDLGLTVAVERNLDRIFSIVYDYIEWHKKALEESENPDEDSMPLPIEFAHDTDDGKKGIAQAVLKVLEPVKKFFKWISGLFKRKPKPPVDDTPVDDTEETGEENPVDDGSSDITQGTQTEKLFLSSAPASEDEDFFADTSDGGEVYKKRKPYHERYYTLYGFEKEPDAIDLEASYEYLSEMKLGANALKQAREGKEIADYIESTFKPGKPDARYCDFCGTEIFGVEYETLSDGRDRCLACGRSAIKTGEDFRKIFEDVKRNMESFFGIRINVGIKVEMVNSKTLHKRLGKSFVPTAKSDGRVLGVSIKDRNGYSLLIENGSPRMASMLTMVHELCHIWQYINWNDKKIRKKYGTAMRLEIYEGMAKWVEIQYAYLINEPATAKREEIITFWRNDAYGRGFIRYRANYPFSTGTVITKKTPFMDTETPLSPEFCGAFRVLPPTDRINNGDIESAKRIK